MIARVSDPVIINHFANHPDVAFGLDFTGAMRETAIYLFGEYGGFCFEWTAPKTYEVHVMITKAGRGRWGFAAALEARAMIAGMGAERLWARIDPAHRALVCFTARSGFREVERKVLYPGPKEYHIYEWRDVCHQQL